MKKSRVHGVMGIIAMLIIATFLTSTITVEVLGSAEQITTVKRSILYGIVALVVAMAITVNLGRSMAKTDQRGLVARKVKRIKFIGINAIVILIPCAFVLDSLAAKHDFGLVFYVVQSIELIAGTANIILMAIMAKDGTRLSQGNSTSANSAYP